MKNHKKYMFCIDFLSFFNAGLFFFSVDEKFYFSRRMQKSTSFPVKNQLFPENSALPSIRV